MSAEIACRIKPFASFIALRTGAEPARQELHRPDPFPPESCSPSDCLDEANNPQFKQLFDLILKRAFSPFAARAVQSRSCPMSRTIRLRRPSAGNRRSAKLAFWGAILLVLISPPAWLSPWMQNDRMASGQESKGTFLNLGTDDPANLAEPVEVDVKVVLADRFPQRNEMKLGGFELNGIDDFEATTTLDSLQGGRRYRLKLSIMNPLDRDFTFEGIKALYSLSNASINGLQFPRNAVTTGTVDLLVVNIGKGDLDIRFEFTREAGRRVVGTMRFLIPVTGTMSFGGPDSAFVVDEEIKTFRLPFFFKEPIEFQRLELTLSDSLSGIEALLQPGGNPGEGLLELRVPQSKVHANGTTGSIELFDPVVGTRSRLEIMLVLPQKFAFSPRLLRFLPDPKADGQPTAMAMLNIRDKQDLPDKGDPPGLALSASLAGEPLKLESVRLGKGIYRIRVFPLPDEPMPPDTPIEWELKLPGQPVERFSTSFLIQKLDP